MKVRGVRAKGGGSHPSRGRYRRVLCIATRENLNKTVEMGCQVSLDPKWRTPVELKDKLYPQRLLMGLRPYKACSHTPVADVDEFGVVSVVCRECPFADYMPISEWMKLESEKSGEKSEGVS